MRLRVLDFGFVPALRSQSVYHGLAAAIEADDDPVLSLVNPDAPYVCVGMHQEIDKEVDEAFCKAEGLPIIRRHVGGGAVYLDRNQMFVHFIYPRKKAPEFAVEPLSDVHRADGRHLSRARRQCRIPAHERHAGRRPQDRRNGRRLDRRGDALRLKLHVRFRHRHDGALPEGAVGEIPRQAEDDARRLHDHDDQASSFPRPRARRGEAAFPEALRRASRADGGGR